MTNINPKHASVSRHKNDVIMASYIPTDNVNLHCSKPVKTSRIGFSAVKNPVTSRKIQHCSCYSCITKPLENFHICSTCGDEPTVENYDRQKDTSGCTTAFCTNEEFAVTFNECNRNHHEGDGEDCEFQMFNCQSCGETTKTLRDMEARLGNIEKNMNRNKAEMEGKFEAVNNDVKGLKTALYEIKEVLVTMEEEKENTRNRPSCDKENIIVAGGYGVDSVEMFNWRHGTWSPLQSMPKDRWGMTSFIYNKHMSIAGGCCGRSDIVSDITRMNIDPKPDLSTHWSVNCPFELPDKLRYHSSALYDGDLVVTGGGNKDYISDMIKKVQLVPPYSVKTLSRMPEQRHFHCTELFEDNLFIVGGTTTNSCKDNLSSVVVYDMKTNELKQLSPLPYEVSNMTTVRWGDNIIVAGGANKHDMTLDTVVIYNVKTEKSHMLPSMRCKRRGCSAVVIANNIVVLGGEGEDKRDLKSVESFNFERYSWKELPEMSQARWRHSALFV